jgi:hypothetical protein
MQGSLNLFNPLRLHARDRLTPVITTLMYTATYTEGQRDDSAHSI